MRLKRHKKQEDVDPPPGSEGAGIAPTESPEEPVAHDPDAFSHLPPAPGPSGNHVESEIGQQRFVAVEQGVAAGHLGIDPGLYPKGKLSLPARIAIVAGHVEALTRLWGRSAMHLAPIRAKVYAAAFKVVKGRVELDEIDRAIVDASKPEAVIESAVEDNLSTADASASPEPLEPVVEATDGGRPIPPAVRNVLDVVAKYELPILAALITIEAAVSGSALDRALGLPVENLAFVVAVALAAVMVLAAEQAGSLLMVPRRGARALGATILVVLLALSVPLGFIRAAEILEGDPIQWTLIHTGIQGLAVLVGMAVVFAKRYGFNDPAEVSLLTPAPLPTLQQLMDARGDIVDRVIDSSAVLHFTVEVANASTLEAMAYEAEVVAAEQHTLASHDHALFVADPALGPFLEAAAPTTQPSKPAVASPFDAKAILTEALAAYSLPFVYRPPDELAHALVPPGETDTRDSDSGEPAAAPEETPVTVIDLNTQPASANGHGEGVTP